MRALAVGADDVVFGSGDSRDGAGEAEAVRAAIVAAVRDGRLSRTRLRSAASRIARASGATTC